MKITIRGKEYTLRNTIRMYVMFEAVKSRAFDPSLISDVLVLYYSCLVCSGCKDLSYDDLVSMVDGEIARGHNPLGDFVTWLAGESERQRAYMPESEDGSKKKG